MKHMVFALLGFALILFQVWMVELSLTRFWCSKRRHVLLPLGILAGGIGFVFIAEYLAKFMP